MTKSSRLAWFLMVLPGACFGGQPEATVCHVTGSGAIKPIEVDAEDVAAHLRHGDYLPFFYTDADGDGFGDANGEWFGCAGPAGTVDNADDCDDSDDFVNPDAPDECGNGIDEDCSGDDALCSVELDGWSLSSGRVEPDAAPDTVTGTYTLTEDSTTGGATRGGGGCLVADLYTQIDYLADFECVNTGQCLGLYFENLDPDADPDAPGTPPADSFLYCGRPDGSAEDKRCWVRWGDTCARSSFRTPGEYAVNATLAWPASEEDPTTPGSEVPRDPVDADPLGTGEPVRWMVLSCMAADGNPAGCASSDATQQVFSFGPAYTWTPSE